METSCTLTYEAHGDPAQVLQLRERPLGELAPDHVRIRMLRAMIHPSDFGMILGKYGRLPELPAVGGREAVGEVVALGAEAKGIEVGARVRFPEAAGVWQSYADAPARDLLVVPPEIPLDLAAMAFINPPTAWRLLRDAHLDPGAWIIQNAANSAVGQFVIQMARQLDVRTLNVVRRGELVEPLQAMGADVVELEESGYHQRVREITGGQPIKLALNSVGGESAIRLVSVLGEGGVHVTFGGMAFEPVRFPTRQLIFGGVRLEGFWLDKWYRSQSPERVGVMFSRLFALMREAPLRAPVEATYPLDQFKEALAHAQQPRLGKVLFRGEG